jgi:DNA-binding CsgD family transcriptional regulator
MLRYVYSLFKNRKELEDEIEYEKSRLFDLYTFVLILILVCNSVLNYFFIEQLMYSVIFLGLSILMTSTFLLPNKIRFNKNRLILLFFFLGFVIFYCDIVSGEGVMNYLSYISLTIVLGFFFDYNKDKLIIFILISTYLTLFFINVVNNHSLFSSLHQHLSPQQQYYVRANKVLEISLCTLAGIYCINRREKLVIKLHIEKERLNELLKKTDKIAFYQDLYELAMSKNSLFITYFKSQFPDFFENILSAHPSIVSSELEICALISLNLSTKEIATATNSTIRSVENKKYRIRKKLNIPVDVDTSLYIINNF